MSSKKNTKTPTTKQASTLTGTIDQFLRRVKEAEGYESGMPAAGMGDSSHMSESVDDGTKKPEEGARAKENEKDVKEQEGAASVNSTTEASARSQDSVQYNIGTNQSAVGEDPAVEDAYKDKPEDSPTTAPAKVTADQPKYSSDMNFEKLLQTQRALGEKIASFLGQGATQAAQSKTANPTAPAAPAKKPTSKQDLDDVACKVAWELAGVPGGDLTKEAVDQLVAKTLTATILDASRTADKIASYIFNELQKAADDEGETPEAKEEPDENGGDEGLAHEGAESPAMEMGEHGGGDGQMDDALLAQLFSGEDIGGDEAMAGMAGGDMGGGDMGGDMGGGAPGGGGDEAAMLQAALEEAGISPEELMAATAGKAAAAVKTASAKPKWKPKTAQDKKRYEAMLGYVREQVPVGK